jgi:hypothetical protein
MWDVVDALLEGLWEWSRGRSFWWGVFSFFALSVLVGVLWWVVLR